MKPTFAPTSKPTLKPTRKRVLKSFLGHKYCAMSLMIAQSAFLCSLFDTICSASSGSFLDAGSAGLSSALMLSGLMLSSAAGFRSTSCCIVRALASSFLCRGVDVKTRRERSSKREADAGALRRASTVWREHGTKPGRASSRLASILSNIIREQYVFSNDAFQRPPADVRFMARKP